MSIKRPFLKFTINEIETLFESDKGNLVLICQIKNELKYRGSKRSKKFKKEIDAIGVIKNKELEDKGVCGDDKNTKEECKLHKEALRNLIEAGKDKGFLAYTEINKAFPKYLLTQEKMRSIISILKELDINVHK
jgi:hypothetical protein